MSVQQIVCPVCATQQPNAWNCAVCGGALHDRPRHWAVPVEQLEGLEPTALDAGGNVGLLALPDLEPTAVDDGVEPLPELIDGLETTAFSPAPPPAAQAPLPDLEPTALPGAAAPVAAAPSGCRTCGTPWQPGGSVFCARCGMRVATRTAGAAAAPAGDGVTCRSCGLAGQSPGAICRGCQHTVVANA